MHEPFIVRQLEHNGAILTTMFSDVSNEMYTWKPAPDKWCLLEILCHLYDEEQFDFKPRIHHVMNQPEKPMSPIDPVKWVTEHSYMQQDYRKMLGLFVEERSNSIRWLRSLSNPAWSNVHLHPKLGQISASMLLANWLAHDYLHIRQITSVKYHYLVAKTNQSLSYAGNW